MKKKMLALLLACLCLSLAACAKTEVPAAEAPTQTQPAETPACPGTDGRNAHGRNPCR